jgi:hypothetical protein
MLKILVPRSIGLSSEILSQGKSPLSQYRSTSSMDSRSSLLEGSYPFSTFMLLKGLLISGTSASLLGICSLVLVSMYFLLLRRSLK